MPACGASRSGGSRGLPGSGSLPHLVYRSVSLTVCLFKGQLGSLMHTILWTHTRC